jgi:hypothetical protein
MDPSKMSLATTGRELHHHALILAQQQSWTKIHLGSSFMPGSVPCRGYGAVMPSTRCSTLHQEPQTSILCIRLASSFSQKVMLIRTFSRK